MYSKRNVLMRPWLAHLTRPGSSLDGQWVLVGFLCIVAAEQRLCSPFTLRLAGPHSPGSANSASSPV